jgi:hypothetical protein
VRFSGWFCLVLGVAILFAAGVLGVLAIQQATEISAYHHARACQADAPSDAGCLLAVDGSVAAVTEFPGGGRVSADYALDVRTASRTPSCRCCPPHRKCQLGAPAVFTE